ncbi:hypothetical protein NDU88_001045 [Pleurodeles waltl]|uniref:Uncharacterized protein n=1 Tax=Pleurodeles waltl TaxID=8319 RepID=A0AAV7R7V9_PLEWA|nr:hypothetical protein NDU88_001045 [Pleurodeles waltl]
MHRGQRKTATLLMLPAGERERLGEHRALAGLADGSRGPLREADERTMNILPAVYEQAASRGLALLPIQEVTTVEIAIFWGLCREWAFNKYAANWPERALLGTAGRQSYNLGASQQRTNWIDYLLDGSVGLGPVDVIGHGKHPVQPQSSQNRLGSSQQLKWMSRHRSDRQKHKQLRCNKRI